MQIKKRERICFKTDKMFMWSIWAMVSLHCNLQLLASMQYTWKYKSFKNYLGYLLVFRPYFGTAFFKQCTLICWCIRWSRCIISMAYAVAGKTQINAKGAYFDPAFDVLWFRATCKGTVLISRIRYFFYGNCAYKRVFNY